MDRAAKDRRSAIVTGLAFVCGVLAVGVVARVRAQIVHTVEPEVQSESAPLLPRSVAPPSAHTQRSFGLRLVTASTFVALFVAGGAFAAWGGNQADQFANGEVAIAPAETTTELTSVTDAALPDLSDATVAQGPVSAAAQVPVPVGAPSAAPAAVPVHARPLSAPVIAAPRPAVPHPAGTRLIPAPSVSDSEGSPPGSTPLVWATPAALPDPTPSAPVLRRMSARELVAAAGTGWPVALAVAQAAGRDVNRLTPWALHVLGRRASARGDAPGAASADQVRAASAYYRAVGMETLVHGLRASRDRLGRRLLADPRVSIYPGGQDDIRAGRVNERVLAVVAYLAEQFGSVEISSLVSGHRLFARPRVVSAHIAGEAVDIAALGGVPVAGHQEPGGVTERAVRDLLLLPADVEPGQIISLFTLGGASFGLVDHADHIHVGF